MAKIKLSAWIPDIRNSIGGTVFSKNRGGAYAKNLVIPSNPQTSSQQIVRGYFQTISQAWRSLTQAQRDTWNAAVNDFKLTDVFGDIRTPSGFTLHQRLNKNLLDIGVAVLTSAPIADAVVGSGLSALVADTTAGTLTATFTPAIDANTSAKVFATPPLSAGVNNARSFLRQIAVADSTVVSPKDWAAEYIAKFGALPPIGQKVFMSYLCVNETNGLAAVHSIQSDIAV